MLSTTKKTSFSWLRIMGAIGGGWNVNAIYSYRDGYPLHVTIGGGCNTNAYGGQGSQSGTCERLTTPARMVWLG